MEQPVSVTWHRRCKACGQLVELSIAEACLLKKRSTKLVYDKKQRRIVGVASGTELPGILRGEGA